LQPVFSSGAENPGNSRINPPAGPAVWNFIGAAGELPPQLFQERWRAASQLLESGLRALPP
jgi:hypothetical protein